MLQYDTIFAFHDASKLFNPIAIDINSQSRPRVPLANIVVNLTPATRRTSTMESVGMDPSGTEWMSAEHSMGTTIMAVTYANGVVMGADSRTTTGSYIANRVSDKITPICDGVFCCRSGSAADTQIVSDYVRYYTSMHDIELGTKPRVATVARLFRELCYQNKGQLIAGIIVAGTDDALGGQVYTIPLGGALVRQPFAIGGSGSTYIYGMCDSNYKEGMTKEECEEFVTKALSLAMARDGSSGGVVRLVTIDKAGTTRKFVPGNKLPKFWEG